MNAEHENFSIYETENSVVFALRPDFDIKKLKLVLGENITRFFIDGKIYREIRFQKKIDPINAKTSFNNNILRIEIPKKTESFMEINFGEFKFDCENQKKDQMLPNDQTDTKNENQLGGR